MARPALAPELHAVKGTQVEFRKRPTVSAVAEGSRPVCPRHVKGAARKAWNDVVRLLVRRKTLDEAARANPADLRHNDGALFGSQG